MEDGSSFPNPSSKSEGRQGASPARGGVLQGRRAGNRNRASYGLNNALRVPTGKIHKRSMRIVRTRAGHGWLRGTQRWIRVRFDKHDELYVPDSEEEEDERQAINKEQDLVDTEMQVAAVTEVEGVAFGVEQAGGAAAKVESATGGELVDSTAGEVEVEAVVGDDSATDAAAEVQRISDEAWMSMLKIYLLPSGSI